MTPRTDAAELECSNTYGADPLQFLCRQLERELAAQPCVGGTICPMCKEYIVKPITIAPVAAE